MLSQKKWGITINVLGVFHDVISRSSGLKVPQGCYYLVDARYCNSDEFLAPYRGHKYHLNEWEGRRPEIAKEYFNMKHSRARNVIERCFGLLNGRWKILASPSFFPMQTQVRIIIACCLLHNLICKFMSHDPQECIPDEDDDSDRGTETEYMRIIGPTDQWTAFRNNLAQQMFNNWENEVFDIE
ncbi:hypothetical protein ZIOFF_059943 [Zingiber officinale]|uniref:DDE Tnp4 domain-containing protein n=1 Tax=Zingiber officinale TaxID=94328 RepID=A0A8J5F9Y5_ZINOF|nr:hypothetical protein ZIOFF_059943 [Zingiber officinale]